MTHPILCADSVPNFLNFFDLSIAPTLLYYTYLPAIAVSLFLGFMVWKKDNNSLVSRLLLFITIFFALWVFDILVLWIGAYNDAIMFGWEITPFFEVPLFIFSVYFALVMTDKERKDINPGLKLFFITIMFAVFAALPTSLNIQSYDISICEGVPGLLFYAMYGAEILAIFYVLFVSIIRYRKTPAGDTHKQEILYVSSSIIAFMVLFSGSNLLGQITGVQQISFIGSLGMVVFLGVLVYIIVRFKEFNIKLLEAQALVWSVVFLIGSQFFFIKTPANFVLNGFTFVITIILGNYLVRSVKKEIEQKEELAELLEQRESLEHLISHKVKGSFTRSKYIFAEMLENSFGELPPELRELAKGGLAANNSGIQTVDLILNSFNLQNGVVQFEIKKIDFRMIVESVVEEKRGPIEDKGLTLEVDIKDGEYHTMGDETWLKEVANNLVENAFRYTKEGKITVYMSNINNKILFCVADTGVGITPEDKANLFKQGGRGKESLKINTDSTGYGLYSVKLVLDQHKGRVWAESEGEGKGSKFCVELNIAK